MQGYVGATVNIPTGVRGMLESLDDLGFLAFTPRDGAGTNLPLAQHLSILGYAIVTIASRGLPQNGADLYVALARLEALGRAFSAEATTLNDHVMEHFRRRSPGERAKLAALATKDLETFTLDMRGVSDSSGHARAYPPPVESFPAIPGSHTWRPGPGVANAGNGRRSAGAASVTPARSPSSVPLAKRAAVIGARRLPAGGRPITASQPAALYPWNPRPRGPRARARQGLGVAVQVMGAAAVVAAAAAAATGRRVGGASLARRRPRLMNRGTGLGPQWGRGRS